MDQVVFIADIASNHNSNISTLFEMMDACSKSGVTCVKLQSFKASKLVSNSGFNSLGETGAHHDKWKESVFESYKKAETPLEWLEKSFSECEKKDLS